MNTTEVLHSMKVMLEYVLKVRIGELQLPRGSGLTAAAQHPTQTPSLDQTSQEVTTTLPRPPPWTRPHRRPTPYTNPLPGPDLTGAGQESSRGQHVSGTGLSSE
ncbi:unnamed protein product [Boreogadus saida]